LSSRRRLSSAYWHETVDGVGVSQLDKTQLDRQEVIMGLKTLCFLFLFYFYWGFLWLNPDILKKAQLGGFGIFMSFKLIK